MFPQSYIRTGANTGSQDITSQVDHNDPTRNEYAEILLSLHGSAIVSQPYQNNHCVGNDDRNSDPGVVDGELQIPSRSHSYHDTRKPWRVSPNTRQKTSYSAPPFRAGPAGASRAVTRSPQRHNNMFANHGDPAVNMALTKSPPIVASKLIAEYDLVEDYVRCICDDTNSDDGGTMINCDGCSAWQHNVCMGLSEREERLPEKYFCEVCSPQDHTETVRALKEGYRIWEQRRAAVENSTIIVSTSSEEEN